jgi:hypothetical protein
MGNDVSRGWKYNTTLGNSILIIYELKKFDKYTMLRRQVLDWDDWGNPKRSHITTPRKRSSWMGNNVFEHVIGYREKIYGPTNMDPAYKWIGRKLIPFGMSPWYMFDRLSEKENVIAEEYIAYKARPYIYRIIFVKGNELRSKPEIHYVPNRINLLVDADTERIVDILYM